jgi:hypothetical protein
VTQEAVNHWVNREVGRVTAFGGTGKSVNQVMAEYNAASATASDNTGRFSKFESYLDDGTRAELTINTSNGRISSSAMRDTGIYLTLPNWTSGSYPKIEIHYP